MAQLAVESAVPAGSGPKDDTEAKSWRLGKVLLESAREEARFRTSNFYEEWRFTLGENHWPTPTSYRALVASRWQARTIRNWLWATIDHKAAVVLDAEPMIHVEPLNEITDFVTRQKISSAIKHELQRLDWNARVEDMFLDGAVLGKGLVHLRTKRDKITQEYQIVMEQVDPQRFYPDPSATRLADCRFVVYEPILDMSTIRDIFPEKAHLVKPTITTDLFRYQDALGYTRTDQDLVEGTSGTEYVFGKDGKVKSRRAEVAFIWIKDETLTQDIELSVTRDSGPGYECLECGSQFEVSEALPTIDPTTGEMNPDSRMCPECASTQLKPVQLEALTKAKAFEMRAYPYGRLIAMSGNTLLYDGPNPHDIEEVFPFVEYNHYRVPRRFWGYGDTALLKSAQRVADKNMAQALDYMRLAANGPFEYPSEAEAYAALGTGPGQLVPVPAPYVGMAHWVTPNGFDRAMFAMVDSICIQDFQRVGGVSDVSSGVAPVAATSGVEVQARQRAASTRLGQHLRRLNKSRSDMANMVWQMMNQYYVGERMYLDPNPQSEVGAIGLDVSLLPKGVRVRVTADPDDNEKDNLMGQNLGAAIQTGAMTNPMVLPFLDIWLRAIGLSDSLSTEMQRRVQMVLMGMIPGATQPTAPTSEQPPEAAGEGEAGGPQLNQDQAMEAMGA